MSKQNAKKKIYYLYDKQINHIKAKAKKMSISDSSALRVIINNDIEKTT